MVAYTSSVHKKYLPKAGHWVHLVPRHKMRRRSIKPHLGAMAWPGVLLPVGIMDTSWINSTLLIDGNDTLGICGDCMAAHTDQTLTRRATGKASIVSSLSLFEAQYEKVSGGDNGTDEDMMTGPIWGPQSGGIAGITPSGAILYDHLDLDLTPAVLHSAVSYMGFVCVGMSLCDAWINDFDPKGGTVWDMGTPNPNDGHFVPILGFMANGNAIAATWGSWVQITPAGLACSDPEFFTGFTLRGFNPVTGLYFDGLTYQQKTEFWGAVGGNVSALPVTPFPTPSPNPTPPPPSPPVPSPLPTRIPDVRIWQKERVLAIPATLDVQEHPGYYIAYHGGQNLIAVNTCRYDVIKNANEDTA